MARQGESVWVHRLEEMLEPSWRCSISKHLLDLEGLLLVYLFYQGLIGACGCIFFFLLYQRSYLLRQIRNLRENSSRPELIIY